MDGRRWSNLPADVVREISGRLWASADHVHFHAVSKPWRHSHDPPLSLSRRTTSTQFLPWLLAPAQKESSADLKFWCTFSKACYRAPASPVPCRSWVCSADGTGIWYLTVENLRPSLHDPLTGEVTHLPLFPGSIGQWEPSGVVYGNGSTFLYIIFHDGDIVRFKAALMDLGDTEWTVVERTFRAARWSHDELYAAYHSGKIMVTVEASVWHIITPDGHADDVLVPKPELCTLAWHFSWYSRQEYNYLLESRGQLLWAFVHVETNDRGQRHRVGHKLYLSVHALEEEEDSAPKKTMRWVRKDGKSLADRVLFLGWPNSFAVDASRLGGEAGACAYMGYSSGSRSLPRDHASVFMFNLLSNKTEFMDWLPREWNEGRCTWIIPQPAITPIQELTDRRLTAQELKRQQHTTPINALTHVIHIERYYGPSFRALVRNLPLNVTSSQLRLFLSKHGIVSDAKVLFYKKPKRSQGIGELTMSTIHTHIEDAVEALSALFLHGYPLDVILAKEERRRLRMP